MNARLKLLQARRVALQLEIAADRERVAGAALRLRSRLSPLALGLAVGQALAARRWVKTAALASMIWSVLRGIAGRR